MPNAMKTMQSTRIEGSRNERAEVAALLNALLASTSDLTMQAKTAHWNVKGPHFIALHELFDKLYEELGEHVDIIAERIAALGATVMGRVQDAAQNTTLKPYPIDLTDGMAHVKALADSFGVVAKAMREGIDQCAELDDMVTSDLLTGICGELEKHLWFLEAHLRG